MPTVDSAMKKLQAARKRLAEPQGRIARRNARQAFLAALRDARKAIDDDYPHIRKPSKPRRKRPKKKSVATISQQAHRQLLAAGVRPRNFTEEKIAGEIAHKIWAPAWMAKAWYAGVKPKTIAKAVRSNVIRRRVVAVILLGGKK